MALVLVRVDDRLIHGQVVVGWARYLKADRILVANDEAAGNELQKSFMTIAVPKGITADVLNVRETAELIKSGGLENSRTILLVNTPIDALRLLKEGVKIKSLNLGGVRAEDGRKQFMNGIYLNGDEIDGLKELKQNGVDIETRIVPTDKPRFLEKL